MEGFRGGFGPLLQLEPKYQLTESTFGTSNSERDFYFLKNPKLSNQNFGIVVLLSPDCVALTSMLFHGVSFRSVRDVRFILVILNIL